MEYKVQLYTYENGDFVKKESTATRYYSLSPYLDGDDDGDEIDVANVFDLWKMWQEEKAGDIAAGERGRWKYHFYRHQIVVEPNPISGKPGFVDYVTPGKVYRRGTKVFFKAISE